MDIKLKICISLLTFIFFWQNSVAQPITVVPALPTASDAVTVTFDATKASRTDLVGYSGDVYVHTGVAINGRKWQYVIGSWGINSTQPKLTRTGTNTYTLSISPSIREFYSVPADSVITQMCFVFRSADGSKQTEDIFYDVYEQGLSVSITSPLLLTPIYELNDNIQVNVSANNATSLTLYIDNQQEASTTENTLSYTYTATTYGKHWIKAVASNNDQSVADSAYILVRSPLVTEELPAGMNPGVNITGEQTATVVLYDPQALKNYAYLIGSFSEWLPDEQYYMKRTPDGKYFWTTLTNLSPDQEYAFQFLIDGYLRIADPYTHKTLDPNDQYIPSSTYPGLMSYPTDKTYGIASVFSTTTNGYTWQTADFTPPSKENLIIYEMLIRDFVSDSYIQTAMDSLSYLKKLGVNAVELMPISEFEGNDSWGYNPSFYFAPDKAYGKANDYKAFIDEAHQQGMAVIMDIVLNHSFGQSPLVQLYSNSNGVTLGEPTTDNPWYNQTCPHQPYCWGYDFNHESPETRKFVDSVLTYWLTEYRVDGFRFDFSKGFTNTPNAGSAYDQPRIDNLKRIADKIWTINPDAYVILEHFCDNSEEKVLAEYRNAEGKGMLVWGNLNYNYGEAAMGWLDNSNFSAVAYKQRGWSVPNLVGYMESHDEERLMYKNLTFGNTSNPSHNVRNLPIALKRMELAANFFIPIPGPKMIWQFGELGYDISIDYNGRLGRKPLHWEYYTQTERRNLFNIYANLNRLKQEFDVFTTSSYEYMLSGSKKWIKLDGTDMDVVVMGNFDVNGVSFSIDFPATGKWYEYYTGDSIELSTTNATFSMAPSEYRLYTSVKVNRDDIFVGVVENPDETSERVHLWPNPSNGEFQLSFTLPKALEVQLELYNLMGQKVYHVQHQGILGANRLKVDLPPEIVTGLYIFRINSQLYNQTGKLSIVK